MSATTERMIPESIVKTERRFWQIETEHLRQSDSYNFRDSIKNLRKAGELGSHLLMSLMANIIAACGFIMVIVMDKDAHLLSKIIIGICFCLLGTIAVVRLTRLVGRGE